MSEYLVSARKYRPAIFSDVVGQDSITETLVNGLDQDKIPQAVLFSGPRGVGKTTCARIFAREINLKYTENVSSTEAFEYNIFELDAASNNSVEEIRRLIDQVRYPPQKGKYKVYIIDEVHMLSLSAFNAFLKTLEEPPPYAVFILATTERHKVPVTIVSRCQVFNFKRISNTDMVRHLQFVCEDLKVQAEQTALHTIARKSDGALRDALSTLDKMILYTDGSITQDRVLEVLNTLDVERYVEMIDLVGLGKVSALLLQLDALLKKGFDLKFFLAGLSDCFRDLLLCKDVDTVAILDLMDATRDLMKAQADKWNVAQIFQALDVLDQTHTRIGTMHNPRISTELALLKLVAIHQPDMYQKKKSTN